MVDTTRLNSHQPTEWASTDEENAVDAGVLRPWRMALNIKAMQVKLVIDLISSLSVGRLDNGSETVPDIDLGPFNAAKLGVSRSHLNIKLQEDHVIVVDNASLNGTKINGRRILPKQAYPLRHGDVLTLGELELQVEFLINPLE